MKACIDQDCEKEQIKFINAHKETVNNLKQEIALLYGVFSTEKTKTKQNIDELNKFIERIEEINSCLSKKEYYEKLLSLAPKKTDEG